MPHPTLRRMCGDATAGRITIVVALGGRNLL